MYHHRKFTYKYEDNSASNNPDALFPLVFPIFKLNITATIIIYPCTICDEHAIKIVHPHIERKTSFINIDFVKSSATL